MLSTVTIKNVYSEPLLLSVDLEDSETRINNEWIYPDEVFEIEAEIPSHLKVNVDSFLKNKKPYKLFVNLVDKDL